MISSLSFRTKRSFHVNSQHVHKNLPLRYLNVPVWTDENDLRTMSQSLLQILSMKYARSGSVIICTLASFLFLYELLKPQAQTSVSTHGRTWKPASQTQQDHLNDIRNSTLGVGLDCSRTTNFLMLLVREDSCY